MSKEGSSGLQRSVKGFETSAVNGRVHQRHGSATTSSLLSFPNRQNADPEATPIRVQFEVKPQPVTWLSLPRKDQLGILFMSRLVDFLQVASLQAYMFYQLKSFDPGLSDAAISSQAGILQGCFTGAQVATAMLWGKAADSSLGGRKLVLLIGLVGTAISCIGYGFATTFWQAAVFRVLGGGINGTVGIIRTMIAEITKEKKYQSRAFLLLPMSFNIAGILGPIMGGVLADPAMTLPGIFGENGAFGVKWLRDYPYALPSILNAIFLSTSAALVFFFLEETLKERKGKYDLGLDLAQRISDGIHFRSTPKGYTPVEPEITPSSSRNVSPLHENFKPKHSVIRRTTQKLPFRRIWTHNVIFTLVTTAFFDFHVGAFTNLWSLFLSTPRPLSTENARSLPFYFTGGLAMPAATVGFATSILGMLGMILQIFLYPPVQARLGTLRSFRFFLLFFPFAYLFAPYLSVLPSTTEAPNPAAGGFIWVGITLVLLLQVTARTFALPATIILLNNCSPHPSVLGTVHGLGQSVSASFRTIGPIVGGIWYGQGLERGIVGAAWWGIAGTAAAGCVTALWVYEGSGHEIFLEGELEEGDDMEMEGLVTDRK